jgi:hypothetical protein
MIQLGVQPGIMGKAAKTATDLASALGIDLQSAAMLVGKAIEGNTSMLGRYGIKLDETEVRVRGATYVLDELNQRFGGLAQAEVETYTGKVEKLKNQWDDFSEKLGAVIIPIFSMFADILGSIVDWLNSLSPETVKAIANFIMIGTAVSALLGGLALLIAYFPKIVIGFTAVSGAAQTTTGSIIAITGAIGASYAAAKLFVELYDDWLDRTNDVNGAEAKLLKTIEGKIAQHKKEKDRLVELHKSNIDYINDKDEIADKIKKEERAINNLEKLYKSQARTMNQVTEEIGTAYLTQQAGAEANAAEIAAIQYRQNIQFIAGWHNAFVETRNQMINWHDNFISLMGNIESALAQGFTNMYVNGVDTFDKLQGALGDIWEAIKLAIVQQLATILAEYITHTLAMQAITLIWAGIEWAAQTAIAAAKTIAGWSAIPFIGPVLGIAAATALIHEMESKFMHFAEGGLVTGKTIGMIGEAGPELALPLENPRTVDLLSRAMQRADTTNNIGGSNVVVNVTTDSIPNRRKARELGQIVGDEIFNKIKKSRKV